MCPTCERGKCARRARRKCARRAIECVPDVRSSECPKCDRECQQSARRVIESANKVPDVRSRVPTKCPTCDRECQQSARRAIESANKVPDVRSRVPTKCAECATKVPRTCDEIVSGRVVVLLLRVRITIVSRSFKRQTTISPSLDSPNSPDRSRYCLSGMSDVCELSNREQPSPGAPAVLPRVAIASAFIHSRGGRVAIAPTGQPQERGAGDAAAGDDA